MAPLDGMETLSARLASFNNTLPAPKRRGSNAKGQKSISWPHSAPSPKELAEAGLYYNPTASSPDNTTCFHCEREIEGWEEDDEPDREHFTLSSDCGWAIIRNIFLVEQNTSTMEDPTNERLLEARKSTFKSHWPHENKRGWICKTEKMAAAGWHFAPTAECEDFVSCAYCRLSLDGWEPKDSPFDEHYRRSADCPFFVFAKSGAPKKRRRTGRSGRAKTSTSRKTKAKTAQLSMPGMFSPVMADADPSFDSVAAGSSPTLATANNSILAAASNPPAPANKSGAGADERVPVSISRASTGSTIHVHRDITSSPLVDSFSPVQREEVTPQEMHKTNEVTPSPSPQSSDAENQPPSSRPASVRPPLAPLSPLEASVQGVPFAPSTPGRVLASPSKIGGLKSKLPWTGVDVDMIFAASPGKENDDNFLRMGRGDLSSPEKPMSVEEWIRSQASRAEENLKAEAERFVNVFETEGGRALRVLESIEIAE